ncbi:MAG: CehA/McbA family metallohydrolase, partial [Sandaracinaceae bacterium]
GVGRDALGEIFPSFLLQAVEVQSVEIRNRGADGGPAEILATGTAGDFVELAGVLNRLVLGSHENYRDPFSRPRLRYELRYTLPPEGAAIELGLRVVNISEVTLSFPSPDATMLAGLVGIDGDQLPVPVGDVAVFTASSRTFVPGIGFDLRFGIEAAARTPRALPALPGIVTPWIATRGDGVSYGLMAVESERNYAWQNRDQYGADGTPIDRSTLFLPFAAGGFITVFYETAPPTLAPGDSFEVARRVVVGRGDVGSVLDEMLRLRGVPVGRLSAEVRDVLTNRPATDAYAIVDRIRADGSPEIFSQYDVRSNGSLYGDLEPGEYRIRLVGDGRPMSEPIAFTIREGETTFLRLGAPSPARLVVRIQTPSGEPLPARATVVGTYGAEHVGTIPRAFLNDLQAGEAPRVQDLVPDDADDASTRRYIEGEAFTEDGIAVLLVRPGTYEIVSSRGPEYDVARDTVELAPGSTTSLTHTLTRVVDTVGWIAADMHLHSQGSHDSSMTHDARVRSIAAEGVEWAVASEHNAIADYSAAIERTGLHDWLRGSIGLEVTTIEAGHFNGYPLRYDVADVQRGAIRWADVPPQEIFDRLRALGSLGPERTIVSVNHARQPVLGYFSQFRRDTFTMDELPAGVAQVVLPLEGPQFVGPDGETTFSFDFDVIEVVNGKLFRDIHHYRVPEGLPPDAPADLPEVGAIVRDSDGQAVFAGVVDDWYTLLNLGYRPVGVGSSDSHDAGSEAGQFRTLVYVGEDDVTHLDDARLVDGLRGGRAVATNGPFVDFWVIDPDQGRMGSDVQAPDPSADLRVGIEIRAAPWVRLDHLNVVRNGEIAQVYRLERDRDYATSPFTAELSLPLARDGSGAPRDSWFVVEVVGLDSLFPVIRPFEVSPFQISEAVDTLLGDAGSFGPNLGSATPSENLPVTAYALTNPVWVTTHDGAFEPPGPVPADRASLPVNDSGIVRGPSPAQTDAVRRDAPPDGPVLSGWLFGRAPGTTHDLGAIMRRAALGHAHPEVP